LNEKNSLREEILAGRKFGGLLPKLPNPQNCLPAKISSLSSKYIPKKFYWRV